MAEGGEKTEMPTQKKLRDARDKGQVCTSKDIVSTAILVVLFAVLAALGTVFVDDWTAGMAFVSGRIAENDSPAIRESGKLFFWIVCKHSFLFVLAAAFVGIAATVVYIPDSCGSIGAAAFRDCPNLCQVRIPAGCAIGEDAFAGDFGLKIFGYRNSPAETYCSEHLYLNVTHGIDAVGTNSFQ